MAPLITEISEHTGLPWFNNPGSFKSTKGLVTGVRDGFLVSIGIVGQQLGQVICTAIRFRCTADDKALLSAMDQFKTFTGGGSYQVQGQTLVWSLPRPIQGTSGKKFTEQLDKILRELSLRAQPFEMGKCEGEGCTNEISEITLINGNANLICPHCKVRVAGGQEEKRRAYEAVSANYSRGFLYGIGGALVTGAGAALLSYVLTDDKGLISVKLECVLPILIATATAHMVKKGITRISKVSTLTAIIPTFLGILLSNLLYYALLMAHVQHLAMSAQLLSWVLLHLTELKWFEYGKVVSLIEACCIFGSAHILWEMRPKFPAGFMSIGAPVITHSGMARAAKVGF